ncbi:MAG: PepSY-associated TM helix domain-containing protein [Acetobacteraceae bacterium]
MFSDTLRQRMGWLHAWVGFIVGLLLVVIFSCGALTTFDTEITRWMQPELARDPSPEITEAGMNTAIDEVAQMQAHGFIPLIILLSIRDPFLRVVHYDGTSFIGPVIDPTSGALRTRRVTYGGTFFYVFHHGLFLPKPWGSIPTEITALMLLVTLGAGVITQLKRLLPDFFAFPASGAFGALLDRRAYIGWCAARPVYGNDGLHGRVNPRDATFPRHAA